jgi:hypothetical protein
MEDALKKLTSEIAAEFKSWLESQDTKDAIASIKSAGDTGTFEVVITTENLDRYQEVIKLDGWELEHYKNNPVVLWGHDYRQLPIGIATDIRIENGKMIATGKFAAHDFAQTVRQLYDAGIMRATSVGFIEKEREGNLITKAELLEFSFVSIPANPYALSTLVKSGVSINEMVTKGFVFVEKDAEPEAPAGPAPEATPAPEAEQIADNVIVDSDAKTFTFKCADTLIATIKVSDQTISNMQKLFERHRYVGKREVADAILEMKRSIVALEDLVQKSQEPEGNEPPAEETEEEKALKEFSAKRKILQDASTVLAEVLAEARQAIEAHKA